MAWDDLKDRLSVLGDQRLPKVYTAREIEDLAHWARVGQGFVAALVVGMLGWMVWAVTL